MKTKYPQYRVTQWIDTSPEALEREQASITYGVQTMRTKGENWMHVSKGTEPMFFDSLAKASEACDALRARDAAACAA